MSPETLAEARSFGDWTKPFFKILTHPQDTVKRWSADLLLSGSHIINPPRSLFQFYPLDHQGNPPDFLNSANQGPGLYSIGSVTGTERFEKEKKKISSCASDSSIAM